MTAGANHPGAAQMGRGPSVGLSIAIVGVTFFVYVFFNYYQVPVQLYAWSKTLASYDYRQYLGMSKRWAMQYGHLVFVFIFLVMSRYIFVSNSTSEGLSKFIKQIVRYTLPIFLFHFPLLYFFTAITEHDPSDPLDQIGHLNVGNFCLNQRKVGHDMGTQSQNGTRPSYGRVGWLASQAGVC